LDTVNTLKSLSVDEMLENRYNRLTSVGAYSE